MNIDEDMQRAANDNDVKHDNESVVIRGRRNGIAFRDL